MVATSSATGINMLITFVALIIKWGIIDAHMDPVLSTRKQKNSPARNA